jgi:hypothetical protein
MDSEVSRLKRGADSKKGSEGRLKCGEREERWLFVAAELQAA